MRQHSVSTSPHTTSGFTLVELLVVIFIIGTLAGLLLTNFVGVRGRATDSAKKNNLRQLKSALRLYYNDHNLYPAGAGTLLGCGAGDPPTSTCGEGDAFPDNSSTVYMKQLPTDFAYYSDGDEEFLIVTPLENLSDEDIERSQEKCDPESKSYFTPTAIGDDEYVECSD